jgi:hypothetical protein
MRRRLRLTGFARFFIVMMFVIPLAYFGASYYRGEDGLQNIKDFLGVEKGEPAQEEDVTEIPESAIAVEIPEQTLENRLKKLEKDNALLLSKVSELEAQLKALKERLDASKKPGTK